LEYKFHHKKKFINLNQYKYDYLSNIFNKFINKHKFKIKSFKIKNIPIFTEQILEINESSIIQKIYIEKYFKENKIKHITNKLKNYLENNMTVESDWDLDLDKISFEFFNFYNNENHIRLYLMKYIDFLTTEQYDIVNSKIIQNIKSRKQKEDNEKKEKEIERIKKTNRRIFVKDAK